MKKSIAEAATYVNFIIAKSSITKALKFAKGDVFVAAESLARALRQDDEMLRAHLVQYLTELRDGGQLATVAVGDQAVDASVPQSARLVSVRKAETPG